MLTSKEMLNNQIIVAATPIVVRSVRRWIYQLGGVGFIPLGLLDASVIPLPGSMDILTIFLSARKAELWPYYALMATVGSVMGGYVTYRLSRKGGKEALARRFPRKTLERVFEIFERWGLAAVAIPALSPPPVPMVPFLFTAGAMQYPIRKFLFALTLGRMIRYTLLAFLAARYGRHILAFISQHGHPVLWTIIGLIATAVVVFLYFVLGKRQTRA
jgi:membrane protein YqaA with SNARE-associated domain